MTAKERERAFMIGAPLAIIPALTFLPAVTFLIVFPQIAHGRVIGMFILPICALVGSFGLWKLATGAVQKPWGLRPEFWRTAGFADHRRLHRTVSGADDAESLELAANANSVFCV
jgi:hypothetical protein